MALVPYYHPKSQHPLDTPEELLDTYTMSLWFLVALCLLAHSALASNNFYGITISSFRSDGQCRSSGPDRYLWQAVTEVDPPLPIR